MMQTETLKPLTRARIAEILAEFQLDDVNGFIDAAPTWDPQIATEAKVREAARRIRESLDKGAEARRWTHPFDIEPCPDCGQHARYVPGSVTPEFRAKLEGAGLGEILAAADSIDDDLTQTAPAAA